MIGSTNPLIYAREYHVASNGRDENDGSIHTPFRTIGKAASLACAGDIITVHAGTYREWINPPRGGENDAKRIVYRAAEGERVEIKGSERIGNWQHEGNGIWKTVLPLSFFGSYNPFDDLIRGDWFDDIGRPHHTGEVFLNGKSLYEVETLEKLHEPELNTLTKDTEGSKYTWHAQNDSVSTTIWANFHGYDPYKELVEISVRSTCFYPEKSGINYITIKGFHFSQAATQWAAPTAAQIGLVATHWNKGWIIENNTISNSKCAGITLGKEMGTGHNVWLNDQSIDGSLHYIEVIFKTLRNGWNRASIGSHIVRNNIIFDCEQAGICGSMGAAFSEVYGNHIYNIWKKRQFKGAEIAAIKFHGAIDTLIEKNRIHHSHRGIWLDWMTQGTRVTGNLLYENDGHDIFVEVNHGPYLVDNNVFASPMNVLDWSQGGAYVHNLFSGKLNGRPVTGRYTPYFLPHSTEIAGISIIPGGDNRFYNNLFFSNTSKGPDVQKPGEGYGLSIYKEAKYPMFADGNIYFGSAQPLDTEKTDLIFRQETTPSILDEGDAVYLLFQMKNGETQSRKQITTQRLGHAKLPKQKFEQPDGSPITIDVDYLGKHRPANPAPGPFELNETGLIKLKVW